MNDDEIALGGHRREAQHEATTSTIEKDVNEDLAERAEHHTLVVPLRIAIAAYALLHGATNGLLRMFVHRKTAV